MPCCNQPVFVIKHLKRLLHNRTMCCSPSRTNLSRRPCLSSFSISRRTSNNHLRNTLPAQCFAAHKPLSLESSDSVAQRRQHQYDGGGDQACRVNNQAEPLNKAHNTIDASAHVICRKSPDELVECAGRRADTEEKGYFNEDEYDTGNAAERLTTAITK